MITWEKEKKALRVSSGDTYHGWSEVHGSYQFVSDTNHGSYLKLRLVQTQELRQVRISESEFITWEKRKKALLFSSGYLPWLV